MVNTAKHRQTYPHPTTPQLSPVGALWIALLVSAVVGIFLPLTASAAESGISVSPALLQLQADSREDAISFNIHVTNNTAYPVVASLSSRNFTALSTTGSVQFLPGTSTTAHGLARAFQFPEATFTMAPNSSETVPIIIANVKALTPGGHYGAVMVSINTPAVLSSGVHISINEELSVLVFLTTAGTPNVQLQLSLPDAPSLAIAWPDTASLVFTNNGNTQSSPQGTITVAGMFQGYRETHPISTDAGLVLPGTVRLYNVAMRNASFHYPGVYTLSVNYHAAGSTVVHTYSRKFVYVSTQLLLTLASGVLVIVLWGMYRSVRAVQLYRLRNN